MGTAAAASVMGRSLLVLVIASLASLLHFSSEGEKRESEQTKRLVLLHSYKLYLLSKKTLDTGEYRTLLIHKYFLSFVLISLYIQSSVYLENL